MDEMEFQFHLIHDTSQQQYWLKITRSCKYSYVLLMMGKGIAQNM
jgi:hypothetical protein